MRLDHRLPRAAMLLLLTQLVACASLSYTAVPVDSAPPADAAGPCPVLLEAGQRCTALVQASSWQTPTGLQVHTGERYCVRVPPGQVWFDKTRRNTPPHGEQGSWLMRLGSGLKRHGEIAWFSLVAAVQPADGTDASRRPSHQDLSRQPLFDVRQSGALVLYPNDAVGPPEDPSWAYDNNAGQIWVTVQRCVGACDCPVAPLD